MVVRKLDGESLLSNENITVWWAAPNAFVNWKRPTTAELNAALNVTDSVTADGFSFGLQASNQINSRSINEATSKRTRGFTQFSGSLTFFVPKEYDDASNVHSRTFDAVGAPRTAGYLVFRVDGEKFGELAVNGDLISVYRVETGAEGFVFDAENPVRYTVGFLPKGNVWSHTVLGTGAAVVAITPSTSTGAAGSFVQLSATVDGRIYTRGLDWRSSDGTKAVVTKNGLVKRIAAGTATITGTFGPTGATGATTITIS